MIYNNSPSSTHYNNTPHPLIHHGYCFMARYDVIHVMLNFLTGLHLQQGVERTVAVISGGAHGKSFIS